MPAIDGRNRSHVVLRSADADQTVEFRDPLDRERAARAAANTADTRPWAARGRALLVGAILLLTPLAVYWPAIFHDYGMRDGYSNLREAHEEPGKLVQFCASHARPIYGWLLQTMFRRIDTIRQLEWVRVFSALLLGILSAGCYRTLRRADWTRGSAFVVALWIALTPPAQVIAGWSIGWPYVLAALLAVVAFAGADAGIESPALDLVAVARLLGASAAIAISALIYQPSTMFYAVPLAATMAMGRQRSLRAWVRWSARHLVVLASGLTSAYLAISACYAFGAFHKSARVAFERDWAGKLAWFAREPLLNALSLFVLNDDRRRDHLAFVTCAIVVVALLAVGAGLTWRRCGRTGGSVWLAGLLGLPVLAFAISLLAAERYATYRTIFALTAVIVCFLAPAVRSMLATVCGPAARCAIAVAAIGVAAGFASYHAYALLAVPQGNEWQLIRQGAENVKLTTNTRPTVFAIEPTPDDISTETVYHDEFGSLSSNSEWVPKEMFKRAMHDLHPQIPNIDQRYIFACGERLPSGQHFDVVIDLHRLRDLRTPR